MLLWRLDPSTTEAGIAKAVVSGNGSVDYLGLQRFGGGATPMHLVGVELLRGNFEKAVKPVDTDRDSSHLLDTSPRKFSSIPK